MKTSTRSIAALLALTLATGAARREPSTVRVRLETDAGPITLALDAAHAPKTVSNFLIYVDDGRLDGTTFYRASRSRSTVGRGFIQGGVANDVRRKLAAVPFEPTDRTGLSHVDGAVSMAHGEDPAIATCNFTILLGARPELDAKPGNAGYAVFGRMIAGRTTAQRILTRPTGGGTGAMRGQMILRPIRIVRAVRLDGEAKPSGRPRAWLMDLPWTRAGIKRSAR